MTLPRAALLATLVVPMLARADVIPPEDAGKSSFISFLEEAETTCVGDPDARISPPVTWELGGFRYVVEGARVKVTRTSTRMNPDERRIGVVNAIKDDEAETRANLDDFLAKFKEADVDAIIVNGDTANEAIDAISTLGRLATLGVPVYAIIGNMESRGEWNRAALTAHRTSANVLNLDLVRVVDTDGVDYVSLPGYYDKRYTHATGSCVYKPADAKKLKDLATGLDGPVVAISHGPPKQDGKNAIDFAPDVGNVGDADLAKGIEKAGIRFGIFGHILEAGGRATDLSGTKEIRPLTFSDTLFVNPGPANSLPWRMNRGPESYGMAALVTFSGSKAKYEILRSPRRIAVGE